MSNISKIFRFFYEKINLSSIMIGMKSTEKRLTYGMYVSRFLRVFQPETGQDRVFLCGIGF